MSEDAEPAVGVDAAVRADPTDIVALIWKAFDQARSSGRQDWNAMTVAVLKNRLLDLTQRQFRESDYGARSIFDLVLQLPELLELDESTTPPKVILLEAKAGDRPSRGVQRVRPDLWYAIVDYASGRRYVWSSEGRAVPVDSDEANGELVLPTLSRDEQTDLRANFVSRMAPVDLNVAEKLAAWRDEALSPRELPGALQRQWTEEFKEFVVARLKEWFAEHDIPVPADLFVPARRLVRPQGVDDRWEALRALVIRCVEHMTEEELSELRLPPQALLRAQR